MKTVFAILAVCLLLPCSAQEYLKQGDACYTQKNYPCAYENYLKAVEVGAKANFQILYFRIGYCLNQEKKYDLARPWLWKSLAEKANTNACWSMAVGYYNTTKYDSAGIYYRRAFSLSDNQNDRKILAFDGAGSYQQLRKYAEAIALLDSSLKIDPDYLDAYYQKATIYSLQGKYKEQDSVFTSILTKTKDPIDISAVFSKQAKARYNRGKYAEAIPLFHNALLYDPSVEDNMAWLADAHKALNKFDSAEYFYSKLIDIRKKVPAPKTDSAGIARVLNAMIFNRYQMKDTIGGIKKFLPDLIRYDAKNYQSYTHIENIFKAKDLVLIESIFPLYTSMLVKNGRSVDAADWYVKFGVLLESLKQNAKALTQYKTAMNLEPSHSSSLTAFVRLMMNENKHKEAYDSIKRKLPGVSSVYNKLLLTRMQASIAYKLKDTAAAAKILKELLVSTPNDNDANYLLGLMTLARKDSTATITYWYPIRYSSLSDTISEDDKLLLNQFLGVHIYKRLQKEGKNFDGSYEYGNAASHLDKYLKKDSSQPVMRVYAGLAHLHAKRVQQGIHYLQNALPFYQKKNDSLALIHTYLGFAYYRLMSVAQNEKAVDNYEKAVLAKPTDTLLLNDMGTLYFQVKAYSKSVEAFGKLIPLIKGKEHLAQTYYNRALNYYFNKQKAEAIADNNKSLEIYPQYELAKKLKIELDKPGG